MKSHKELESYLDRYCGLILYMREMDEVAYGKLCAVGACSVPLLVSVANSSILGFLGLFFCSEPAAQHPDDFAAHPSQRFHQKSGRRGSREQ